MARIELNQPLKSLNSLQLSGEAAAYIALDNCDDLQQVFDFSRDQALPIIPVGDGTNIVFSDSVAACLVAYKKADYVVLRQDDSHVYLQVDAGHNWHELVDTTLEQGWYGLENLALIPGTVGAAPIQNIGAYGVEVAQSIISVTGVLLANCALGKQGETITLGNAECEFSYRDSVFKNVLRQTILITSVEFCLSRHFAPCIDYPALQTRLQKTLAPADFDHVVRLAESANGINDVSNTESIIAADSPAKDKLAKLDRKQLAIEVRNAVVAIRQEKLPDPNELPNAGSFFKNPIISEQQLKALLGSYPGMPYYLHEPQGKHYKVAAAWLIEQCGFKGHREGVVGMHDQQALVLVHYPDAEATSRDIIAYARTVTETVYRKFGIQLKKEPQLL